MLCQPDFVLLLLLSLFKSFLSCGKAGFTCVLITLVVTQSGVACDRRRLCWRDLWKSCWTGAKHFTRLCLHPAREKRGNLGWLAMACTYVPLGQAGPRSAGLLMLPLGSPESRRRTNEQIWRSEGMRPDPGIFGDSSEEGGRACDSMVRLQRVGWGGLSQGI